MNRRDFLKGVGALSLIPLSGKIKIIEGLSLKAPVDPVGWFMIDGVKVESLGVMPRTGIHGTVFTADVYRLTKEVGDETLESFALIDKLLIDASPSPQDFIKGELTLHVIGINNV